MKRLREPKRDEWQKIIERPSFDERLIEAKVGEICEEVRIQGDEAVLRYTRAFDNVELVDNRLPSEFIERGALEVDSSLSAAIDEAYKNIRAFHTKDMESERVVTITSGVQCSERRVPIQRVGLYIPGGTAPLFSTLLMLGVPALLAGCQEIVVATPPSAKLPYLVHTGLLYSLKLLGFREVYLMGGAQAIAAMAYGTATIPRVDKIFGPGNRYVTAAKALMSRNVAAIDIPAGPTEVLVYADNSAVTEFVVADLLAQAEHGRDSQVILVTSSERIWSEVSVELESQLETLPRKEIARAALSNSTAVFLPSQREAISLINAYAPEHLILACEEARAMSLKITSASSLFLGNLTPESAGDYCSGTNHVLPTNRFARSMSGVSIESFQKLIFVQELTQAGVENIGGAVCTLARAEGLEGHARAMEIRRR